MIATAVIAAAAEAAVEERRVCLWVIGEAVKFWKETDGTGSIVAQALEGVAASIRARGGGGRMTADNFRQVAEAIIYDAPDWHSSADRIDAIESAIRAAVAGAVAEEREANCKVVCDGCRDEIPLLYGELPLGGVKPYRKTWLHLWNPGGIYTECHAAGIRARGEGEG